MGDHAFLVRGSVYVEYFDGGFERRSGESVGSDDEWKFGSVSVDCLCLGVDVKVKFAFDVDADSRVAFG